MNYIILNLNTHDKPLAEYKITQEDGTLLDMLNIAEWLR